MPSKTLLGPASSPHPIMPLLDVFWACFRKVKVRGCPDPAHSPVLGGMRQLGTAACHLEGRWASETTLELESLGFKSCLCHLTSSVNFCCFPIEISQPVGASFKNCLCCFLGLAPKARFLTSLSLSFLSFNIKTIVTPTL